MHAFMISCRRIRRSRPCSPTPPPSHLSMAFFHAAGFPCFQTGFFSDERKKTSYAYISSHLKIEKGYFIVVVTYLLRVSLLSHSFEKKKKIRTKKVSQHYQDS